MKKLYIILTLTGSVVSAFAQAPATTTQAPQVPTQTTIVAPTAQKPAPKAQTQMQPPAEFINLLQKNAEKIDALIKQVKAGTDEQAKKLVTEIEAIHDELRKFEEKQKTEVKKPAVAAPTGVKGKARKIQ